MPDITTLNREKLTQEASEQTTEPKPRLLDMSATQLIGGALAAMTAAVIGARLGSAGTVLGAAVGSIVAGVAGTVYTTSIKRGRDKLASAFVGRVGDTKVEVSQLPAASHCTSATGPNDETSSWETTGWSAPTVEQPAASAPASVDPVARSADIAPTGRKRSGLSWKPVLLGAVAVFALAFAGITGYELVSGQTLSGDNGTTITQVSEGNGTSTPTDTSSPSAEPSESSTSAEPTAEATTAAPSAEASPSAEPSSEASPSASADPSASESGQLSGSEADSGSQVAGG